MQREWRIFTGRRRIQTRSSCMGVANAFSIDFQRKRNNALLPQSLNWPDSNAPSSLNNASHDRGWFVVSARFVRGTFSGLVNSHWNVQTTNNANKCFGCYFSLYLCVETRCALCVLFCVFSYMSHWINYLGLLIMLVIGTNIAYDQGANSFASPDFTVQPNIIKRIWFAIDYWVTIRITDHQFAPKGVCVRSCQVGEGCGEVCNDYSYWYPSSLKQAPFIRRASQQPTSRVPYVCLHC